MTTHAPTASRPTTPPPRPSPAWTSSNANLPSCAPPPQRKYAGPGASADAEIKQARESAERDISAARDDAARQVADATTRLSKPSRTPPEPARPRPPPSARADHAQAAAADEIARIRADHQRALDQLTAATNARITALEETRDALRIRAERAETDLDAARADNQRLAEQLTQASQRRRRSRPRPAPRQPRPRTPSRTKKTSATRTPHPEA